MDTVSKIPSAGSCIGHMTRFYKLFGVVIKRKLRKIIFDALLTVARNPFMYCALVILLIMWKTELHFRSERITSY